MYMYYIDSFGLSSFWSSVFSPRKYARTANVKGMIIDFFKFNTGNNANSFHLSHVYRGYSLGRIRGDR